MCENRLSDLSVLSIEKEIARDLDDDAVIEEFSPVDKNRRVVLF